MAAGVLVGTNLTPLWTAGAAAVVVAALVALGTAAAARKRRAALEAYRAQNKAKQAQLSETVAGLIRQAVETFYGRVAQVYAPLETFCRAQEAACQPTLERVDALEKAFRKIAARL